MTYGLGYVAAAGPDQELEVKRVSDDATVYKGVVGENPRRDERVHNAIQIAPNNGVFGLGQGSARMYLSTNESNIKVFNLPDMAPITTISCRVNINYAAQSPDGRFLAAVGDSDSVYLYLITPSGFELQQQYTEAKDSGMSCAWSASGSFYAAAHQDGTITVFDVKSTDVIAKYHVPPNMGGTPCRGVKFSKGGVDLMAFSEEESRVHLVDSRMWERTQVLQVGATSVTGISFAPNGSRLYAGTQVALMAFDVDRLSRRSFCAPASYA